METPREIRGACWRRDKDTGVLRCAECWGIDVHLHRVATLVGPLAAGTYNITGVYSGDTNFTLSTGGVASGCSG